MDNSCELVEQQATPTLVVRTRTSVDRLPEVLGPSWGAIMAVAAAAGAQPTDAPFVAFHNADRQDLDVEIGFTFARPLTGEGDVQPGDIPAGRAVQCVHVGPFDQLRTTYRAIEAWMAERDLTSAGPAYEYYLDDPAETAPAEVRTRVVRPVR